MDPDRAIGEEPFDNDNIHERRRIAVGVADHLSEVVDLARLGLGDVAVNEFAVANLIHP